MSQGERPSLLEIPRFQPRRGLAGGHRQTLAAAFLPGKLPPEQAVARHVVLEDGEALVIHDDAPAGWRERDPVALLVHGLAGSHRSGYMVRIAAKLNARGVRTFRMDLRGTGAGVALAVKPYHGGCSHDLLAAVHALDNLCPGSPITLLGFSLGGNIVLKLLGEAPEHVPASVVRAAVVNPPIDLATSVLNLDRWPLRFYDRYFVRMLLHRLHEKQRLRPDAPQPQFRSRPRRLFDFDDQFTAPQSGFRDARDYYERCSSEQFLPNILVPTLVLTSRDDPLIPVSIFERATYSSTTRLHIAEGGGHLGYLAHAVSRESQHWLDARLLDWTTFANRS